MKNEQEQLDLSAALSGVKMSDSTKKLSGVKTSEKAPEAKPRFDWIFLLTVVSAMVVLIGILVRFHLDARGAGHGKTWDEFVAQTRFEQYEIWAAFDESGEKLLEHSSHEEGRVFIPDELYRYAEKYGAAFTVHNHPVDDVPFSPNDLLIFAYLASECGIPEARVVSPNYVYTLRATDGAAPSDKAMYQLIWPIAKSHDDYPEYFVVVEEREGADDGMGTTDAFLEFVAGEFGLEYVRQPIE